MNGFYEAKEQNEEKDVIPAFYASYDKERNINPKGVQGLTK